ncbi:hypothetical protein [Kitasatospora sp. NPDC057223]|uniref:hypothetical protein n=1 Tax=Kitasatospora sp. NPDC057223 TaxID=3346055 RepID=UPI0036424EA2
MTDLRKAAATALLALGLGLAVTPPAHAAGDPVPAPVGAAELAKAREAAQSPAVLDQLGRFFAREGAGQSGRPALEAAPAGPGAARLAGDTVAVYTLDEGFVAGAAGAPVARADFVASRAVSADGRVASVWTVQEEGRWRVVNIASGGDEGDYAAKAASGGGTAFREPQLNAWYVLREGRVLPLDDEARRSVGAGGVTLAAYQRLVHQRYGDKLPGSAYDRAGRGGGYRADDAAPAGHGVALPALTAAAALGVTALTGAGAALRRRPRSGARVRVRW